MSCRFAHLDGAYVLGSLAPAERAEFAGHLRGCDECAQQVRELAGLPGLLSRIPADVLEDPPPAQPVPDTLLPALVAAAGREQRRRTTRLVGLTAAAVAVVALATAGVTNVLRDDDVPTAAPPATPTATSEPTAAPQRMRAVGPGTVTGWVSLTPVAWGTRLDLTCTYGQVGAPGPGRGEDHDYGSGAGGTTYTMLVRTTDGRVEKAATWLGVPGPEMHVTGATSATPATIASLVVRTSGGETVLRLTP